MQQEVLLRYRYEDGTLQAALPMRVIEDSDDCLVTWLAPDTEIMYWALSDGRDPRELPLAERFESPLTTAARIWTGNGVLRVIPINEPYQVIHFWDDDGTFAGWYVNLEACKIRSGSVLDTVDWHLDLWISPTGMPTWKDEHEGMAAVAAGNLRQDSLDRARVKGQDIIDNWPALLESIGDWTTFTAPDQWAGLPLPADWCQ